MDASDRISEGTLELYSMAKLAEPDTAKVEEHLLACESCRERLGEVDTYVADLREALEKARRRARSSAKVTRGTAADCPGTSYRRRLHLHSN